MPKEIEEILRLVQESAKSRPVVTFLRLDKSQRCESKEDLLHSHVGGVPYAIASDKWPIDSEFLLQVRLDEPSLGHQWQGRLLTVFMVFDVEQVVRSYASPTLDQYVPVTAPGDPRPCIPLTSIRFPIGTEEKYPASPAMLCDMVPAIPQLLDQFTNDYVALLSQILFPGVYGIDLESWQISYVGGDPYFNPNPPEPICEQCGDPMRFLFLFGDGMDLGRRAAAGVFCVYGCDKHPYHCKGFIDCS